jgi:hypothetical protein
MHNPELVAESAVGEWCFETIFWHNKKIYYLTLAPYKVRLSKIKTDRERLRYVQKKITRHHDE